MGLITFALILCSGTEAFEVLAGKVDADSSLPGQL